MDINKELTVVCLMIKLYCKRKHKSKDTLCKDCNILKDYVEHRLSKCPYKDDKPFCSNCKIHCYKLDMREKIKVVMRFSGPRLILYHPVIAMRHLSESKKVN